MGHDSSYFVDNEGAASKTFRSGAHSTGAVGQYMHTVCNRWAKGRNNMWLPMSGCHWQPMGRAVGQCKFADGTSDGMMYAYHW